MTHDTARAVVVVPAHNEGAVVARCLRAILESAAPGEFDVLVVSNGSTDDTAARARGIGVELGHAVEVVEIPTPSKIAALRAADAFLATSPGLARIYVDADVVLPTHSARQLAAALQIREPRLALARIEVDSSGSSWLVRQYYRAWLSTGYINRQDAGSGVFGLNAAGVAQVGPLPDVTNDDGYVARRFTSQQRVLCDTSFRSFAARSAPALVRRRARIVNGNRQLDRVLPKADAAAQRGAFADLATAVRERRVPASSAVVYVGLTMAARALAGWRRLRGTTGLWSTDTTTRGRNA